MNTRCLFATTGARAPNLQKKTQEAPQLIEKLVLTLGLNNMKYIPFALDRGVREIKLKTPKTIPANLCICKCEKYISIHIILKILY